MKECAKKNTRYPRKNPFERVRSSWQSRGLDVFSVRVKTTRKNAKKKFSSASLGIVRFRINCLRSLLLFFEILWRTIRSHSDIIFESNRKTRNKSRLVSNEKNPLEIRLEFFLCKDVIAVVETM